MRLIALIEAPLDFAGRALQRVVKVKSLVLGGWIRAIVIDPTQGYKPFVFNNGQWEERPALGAPAEPPLGTDKSRPGSVEKRCRRPTPMPPTEEDRKRTPPADAKSASVS
jgi:hypothetical protein